MINITTKTENISKGESSDNIFEDNNNNNVLTANNTSEMPRQERCTGTDKELFAEENGMKKSGVRIKKNGISGSRFT